MSARMFLLNTFLTKLVGCILKSSSTTVMQHMANMNKDSEPIRDPLTVTTHPLGVLQG